jgi:biopolymer transport protein ExbB
MKKLFVVLTMCGFLSFSAFAQEAVAEEAAQETEQVAEAAQDEQAVAVEEVAGEAEQAAEEVGLYKALKIKFIEAGAGFMALVMVCLILGLALIIERILYLNLASANTSKLLKQVEGLLDAGDVEGAKDVCRNTRGPVASIFYQALLRLDEGIDAVEKSVVSYGGVQASLMERNLPWISLFIGIAPMLGFLGTVIGMIQAFDDIQAAGDISPTVVAGGIKVALITTVAGLIVAIILQIFYNYLLSKVDSLVTDMEEASISLLDIIVKNGAKK